MTSFAGRDRVIPTLVGSFITFALCLVGVIVAANQLLRAAVAGQQWLHPSSFLLLSVTTSVGAFALVAAYWSLIRMRQNRISTMNPSAVVFTSSLTNDLRNVADNFGRSVLSERFTSGFTVAVDSAGITVWRGSAWRPHVILRIDWNEVTEVSTGLVKDVTRNAYGVIFTYSPSNGVAPFGVPFAALGSGLAHIFPLRLQEVDKLADCIRSKAPPKLSGPRR